MGLVIYSLITIPFDASTGSSCWKPNKPGNNFVSQFHSSTLHTITFAFIQSFNYNSGFQ